MASVGMGLKDSGVMDQLAGDVVLFAVPAEEYVEITYRNRLREEGKIEYIGGKPELIRLGAFDDIDMALQVHVTGVDGIENAAEEKAKNKDLMELSTTSNSFIGKLIRYKEQAAHAAAAPHAGINGLNAAMMGIIGVHAQRKTFQEKEYVRFHSIITQGGDLVNVVPSNVRMESYSWAASIEALKDANVKINRAFKARAEVEIQDLPGYLPIYNDNNLNKFYRANAEELLGEDRVWIVGHMSGSTDTGDLSHIMSVCHPWIGGIFGTLHGKKHEVFDQE